MQENNNHVLVQDKFIQYCLQWLFNSSFFRMVQIKSLFFWIPSHGSCPPPQNISIQGMHFRKWTSIQVSTHSLFTVTFCFGSKSWIQIWPKNVLIWRFTSFTIGFTSSISLLSLLDATWYNVIELWIIVAL